MNHLKLPGTLIGTIREKCQERRISFKTILNLFNTKQLYYPKFQTDIDEDKVEQMINSYHKHPEYLLFKDKIVISVIIQQYSINEINYKMYIVDGQHRLEMAKQLQEKENINDFLTFCYYQVNNDKEMKRLFLEVNKDSFKNQKYVKLDDFNRNIYDDLKQFLYTNKSIYFAEKKKETNKRYTITEFIEKLMEIKYCEKFSNIEELMADIEIKNDMFYKKIDYKEYYNDDSNYFYKEEEVCVNNKQVYSLKNNNFIDFLIDNKTVPDHKFKKSKDIISPRLRIMVWTRYFGEKPTGFCPICNSVLKIGKNGFHCGHIISEANGGQTTIDNLKPICATCNTKMGATNWNEYEQLLKIKKKN